jgi:hypothetical protein
MKPSRLLSQGWWLIALAALAAGWYFGILPLPF